MKSTWCTFAMGSRGCRASVCANQEATLFCCSNCRFSWCDFGWAPPPPLRLCLCPAETFRLTHSALKLKFLALVDTWRTRTWPVCPYNFNIIRDSTRFAWTSHWSPAPPASTPGPACPQGTPSWQLVQPLRHLQFRICSAQTDRKAAYRPLLNIADVCSPTAADSVQRPSRAQEDSGHLRVARLATLLSLMCMYRNSD